jgi:hypothetical protein
MLLNQEVLGMVLIQFFLPYPSVNPDVESFRLTRSELVDEFGGVTAYSRSPADGVWATPQRTTEHDTVMMVEIVAKKFDRAWWKAYAEVLAGRFKQKVIHVRATKVEVLDPAAT